MNIWLQHCLPTRWLTRAVGWLARCQKRWVKHCFIRWFIQQYHVDMREAAVEDYREYSNFNAFFTRALKAGARPLPSAPAAIACPVDGSISALGEIQAQHIFQAKGHHYTVSALLAGDDVLAAAFVNGLFLTAYLSPRDYHRVHMPIAGRLVKMTYVPGSVFSVNQNTVAHVDGLFAKNERLICVFATDAGPMVVVMVGAMIVASIETPWHGVVRTATNTQQTWDYSDQNIDLARGEEMGRFLLGSTAIVLFGKDCCAWDASLIPGGALSMGQSIGLVQSS